MEDFVEEVIGDAGAIEMCIRDRVFVAQDSRTGLPCRLVFQCINVTDRFLQIIDGQIGYTRNAVEPE